MFRNIIKKTQNAAIINGCDEAEASLAKLEQQNYIDYIFSSDTDILPFGSSYVFKKNNVWFFADVVLLKKTLGIDQSQLIDLCVILGNDFNYSLKRVGPATALNIIRKYECLENILENEKYKEQLSLFNEQRMKRTKELFTYVLGEYKLFTSFKPNKVKKLI